MLNIYYFYTTALYYARKKKDVPCRITELMYDKRFNYHELVEDYKKTHSLDWLDFGVFSCYGLIFAELETAVTHFNCMKKICNSQDLGEPEDVGDFIYHAGMLSYNIGTIYMQSSHPWAYPSRAIFYGQEAEIRFSNFEAEVEVCPVNQKVYQILREGNHLEKEIKEFLSVTDRPIIPM